MIANTCRGRERRMLVGWLVGWQHAGKFVNKKGFSCRDLPASTLHEKRARKMPKKGK